mgnify:CR=1 FL=1
MNQPKTTLLIFILIAIVILVILIQIFKFSTPSSPVTNKEDKSQIIQYVQPPKLKIVSTSIPNTPIKVTDVIKIRFDKPVDNQSLTLEITPPEETLPLFDQGFIELTIKPINAWDFNKQYTIKILQPTRSQDGQPLDKNYEFSFQSEAYIGI